MEPVNEISGSDRRLPGLCRAADRFFLHPATLILMTLFSVAIPIFEVEVPAAVIFTVLVSLILVICDDLMAIFLPVLLLSAFVTRCYDCYETFIVFLPLLLPLGVALLFHFVFYGHRIHPGATFPGLCAVTLAVSLGGIGSFTLRDYLEPFALYYLLGLGAGLALSYLLIRSQLSVPRDYDIRRKFGMIMTLMGLFAVACIAVFRYFNEQTMKETGVFVEIQASNNLSTLLMFALPFPAWLSLEKKRWLPAFFLIYAGMIASGSRGGALMGTAELVLCLVYLTVCDKKLRFVYPVLLLAGGAAGVLLLPRIVHSLWNYVDIHPEDGLIACVKSLLNSESIHKETRYLLLERVRGDFLSNPIFGRGLLYDGNADVYAPVTGAMNWYHMWAAQVVGSLGIVGILAYGFQLIERSAVTLRRRSASTFAFFLSYLGLFLMSQINPGEFCPLPYALLAMILFIFIETSPKPEK